MTALHDQELSQNHREFAQKYLAEKLNGDRAIVAHEQSLVKFPADIHTI